MSEYLIERLRGGQDLLRLFASSWNPRRSGKTSASQLIVDIEQAITALQQSKPIGNETVDLSYMLKYLEENDIGHPAFQICAVHDLRKAIQALQSQQSKPLIMDDFSGDGTILDYIPAAEQEESWNKFGFSHDGRCNVLRDKLEGMQFDLSLMAASDIGFDELEAKCDAVDDCIQIIESIALQQSKPVPDLSQIERDFRAKSAELYLKAEKTSDKARRLGYQDCAIEVDNCADAISDLLANSPKLEDEPLWCVVDKDGKPQNVPCSPEVVKFAMIRSRENAPSGSPYKAIRVWREKE